MRRSLAHPTLPFDARRSWLGDLLVGSLRNARIALRGNEVEACILGRHAQMPPACVWKRASESTEGHGSRCPQWDSAGSWSPRLPAIPSASAMRQEHGLQVTSSDWGIGKRRRHWDRPEAPCSQPCRRFMPTHGCWMSPGSGLVSSRPWWRAPDPDGGVVIVPRHPQDLLRIRSMSTICNGRTGSPGCCGPTAAQLAADAGPFDSVTGDAIR